MKHVESEPPTECTFGAEWPPEPEELMFPARLPLSFLLTPDEAWTGGRARGAVPKENQTMSAED
jgi:hypothetical protein